MVLTVVLNLALRPALAAIAPAAGATAQARGALWVRASSTGVPRVSMSFDAGSHMPGGSGFDSGQVERAAAANGNHPPPYTDGEHDSLTTSGGDVGEELSGPPSGTSVRPPSERQVEFAQKLARDAGVEVPPGALATQAECSQFIDKHQPAGIRHQLEGAPSDKQVQFAQRLAAEAGIEIPFGTLQNAEECARFIENTRATAPRRPSDKQLAFAHDLAAQRGIPVPEEALSDAVRISAFIDQLLVRPADAEMGGADPMPMYPGSVTGGPRKPSERQLSYARQLAAKAGIALPFMAEEDATSCSDFINEQLSKPTDRQLLYAVSLARDARLGLTFEQLSDKAACSAFIDMCRRCAQPASNPAGSVAAYGAPMGDAAYPPPASAPAPASSFGGYAAAAPHDGPGPVGGESPAHADDSAGGGQHPGEKSAPAPLYDDTVQPAAGTWSIPGTISPDAVNGSSQ